MVAIELFLWWQLFYRYRGVDQSGPPTSLDKNAVHQLHVHVSHSLIELLIPTRAHSPACFH